MITWTYEEISIDRRALEFFILDCSNRDDGFGKCTLCEWTERDSKTGTWELAWS